MLTAVSLGLCNSACSVNLLYVGLLKSARLSVSDCLRPIWLVLASNCYAPTSLGCCLTRALWLVLPFQLSSQTQACEATLIPIRCLHANFW